MLALARRLITLKSVARTGWLDRGVEPRLAESVADHSLGVALLAWACALERQRDGLALDPQRVLLLALVHDLPEAETGDTPPYDPGAVPGHNDPAARHAYLDRRHVRDAERDAAKRAREDAAMQALLAALPMASRSALSEIWEELRQGTSAEARFVKQVDQLETFLQSLRYGEGDADLPIDSFRREVLETLDDPLLRAIRDAAPGTRFGK
jgi:putative hydrolase of HD superfamily